MILRKLVVSGILILASVFGGIFLNAALIDFYKKGPIVLKPDPDYAKLDYESLFYDSNKKIAVADDGTIFVSNTRQHNIYKFKDGKLIKKFGQDGLGVGDTRYPGRISILDNKYLVIQEDTRIGMISVFNFEGKCVKKIKVPYWVWDVVALKNNKIAILNWTSIEDKTTEYRKVKVIIKDIESNREISVAEFNTEPKKRLDESKVSMGASLYKGKFFFSRIGDGNLLFGYSEWTELSIYSPDGKKINSFRVNYQKKKVTQEMKDEFRQIMLGHAERNPILRENMKRMDWSQTFPEWVPYYRNIAVDSDNNILVFENTGFDRINEVKFQVYSKDGNYLGESKIDFGCFKGYGELQLIFKNGAMYSLLQLKDSEDILLNFVKNKTF